MLGLYSTITRETLEEVKTGIRDTLRAKPRSGAVQRPTAKRLVYLRDPKKKEEEEAWEDVVKQIEDNAL